MMRQILIHIRNFIDKLLWKTAKPRTYNRFYGNTISGNSYSVYLTAAGDTFSNNIWSAASYNGIGLYGSADGNQT